MPIAHGEGNYICDEATLNMLEKEGRVLSGIPIAAGNVTAGANPNGSINNIAGILNERGNVLGMMPASRAGVRIPARLDGWRRHIFVDHQFNQKITM